MFTSSKLFFEKYGSGSKCSAQSAARCILDSNRVYVAEILSIPDASMSSLSEAKDLIVERPTEGRSFASLQMTGRRFQQQVLCGFCSGVGDGYRRIFS
jgi:hypothetical protein